MKKLLSLFTIAAAAITMLSGCSSSGNNADEGHKAKITLSASPLTVKINTEGTFSVTSDVDAPNDIIITVTSSDSKILKINDDSKIVTISKGMKTISGKFTGLAKGQAKLQITSSNAVIAVASLNVTVTEETPPTNSKIITSNLSFTTDPATASGTDWHALKFPSEDTNVGTWTSGYLGTTNKVDESAPGSKFIACIDNYGMSCAGILDNVTGKVNLSIFDKDVDISAIDFIENPNYNKQSASWYWPVIYSDTYKSLAGKSGYLVLYLIFSDTNKDIEKGAYPAWIKVSVADNGAVTAEEMAICCDEGSFKTGQKQ